MELKNLTPKQRLELYELTHEYLGSDNRDFLCTAMSLAFLSLYKSYEGFYVGQDGFLEYLPEFKFMSDPFNYNSVWWCGTDETGYEGKGNRLNVIIFMQLLTKEDLSNV